MSKLEILKESLESTASKSPMKKVDFNNAKTLLNNAISAEWQTSVKNVYLNMNREKFEIEYPGDYIVAKDIYWTDPPAAHSIGKYTDKIAKLKSRTNHPEVTKLIENCQSIVDRYLPLSAIVADIRSKMEKVLEEKKNTPEVVKDPRSPIPLASGTTIKKIHDILADESEKYREKIFNDFKRYYDGVVERYMGRPESERILDLYKLKMDHQEKSILRELLNLTDRFRSTTPHILLDDYSEKISKYANKDTQNLLDGYLYKHVQKLAAIIEKLPEISKMDVHVQHTRNGLDSNISINFEDNRKFKVRSQTVFAFTEHGMVVRYPTTFHDIFGIDEKMLAKKMSEEEMLVWVGYKRDSARDNDSGMSM